MVQSGGYWEPQQPAHWVHSPGSSTLGRCPQHPLQEASHPLLEADPPSSSTPLGFCTYCSNLRVLPWHKQKAHWLLLIPWVGISSNVNIKKKKTEKERVIVVIKTGYTSSTQFKAALDSYTPNITWPRKQQSASPRRHILLLYLSFPRSAGLRSICIRTGQDWECCSNKQPPDLSGWKQRWAIGLAKKFGNLLRKWTLGPIQYFLLVLHICWGPAQVAGMCGGMKVLRCEYLQSTLRAPRGSAVSLRASSH